MLLILHESQRKSPIVVSSGDMAGQSFRPYVSVLHVGNILSERKQTVSLRCGGAPIYW